MVSVPPSPPPPGAPLWLRAGSATLAVAGVAAGLAALVYFIGAVAWWIGLKSTGYPPDVGIAHAPRNELVTLGLRGILVVLALTLLFLVALFVVDRWTPSWIFTRRIAVPGLLLIGVATVTGSLRSWTVLAVAIAVAALILAVSLRRRYDSFWKWGWLPLGLGLSLAALSWDYGAVAHVESVFLEPVGDSAAPSVVRSFEYVGSQTCTSMTTRRVSWFAFVAGNAEDRTYVTEYNPCGLAPEARVKEILQRLGERCAVPYFGETGSHVYVGEIDNVAYPARGCTWNAGRIIEVDRDRVLLRFVPEKSYLGKRSSKPYAVVWHALDSFGKNLQHDLW